MKQDASQDRRREMKAGWAVAVVAVAAAGWVGVARAQGAGLRAGRPGFAGARAFERLNLSADQKDQIQAIRQKNRATAKPLVEAVRDARANLKKAIDSDNPDATAVGQATLQLRSAQQKLQANRRATLDEIRSVLTPEQLDQLNSWKHGQRRGGPGPDAKPSPSSNS
jgi:Spy/CpxP family protein refolding chaperone